LDRIKETLGFTLIVQEMLLQLAGTVVMLIFART
jgi:hypothetical protein